MNRRRLLDRFLRYVRIESTANESAGVYPSSPGQLELGALLAGELRDMGAADVEHTERGLVYATIPATVAHNAPVVALNSHVDTSPETTSVGIAPQVIEKYAGGDIVLPGDESKVIRVSENPELNDLVGATLITTDGATLLGGDDKAGIAIIMELAEHLLANKDIPHGPVRILFTCDEEIGHGVDHVDFDRLAADVAYTLDGGGANEIDNETFSADLATVTVRGVNIHPSIAKDRMVNAIRAAGRFIDKLPTGRSPERTAGRDGFLHPYTIEGGVAEAKLKIILRDFVTAALADMAELLRSIGREVEAEISGCRVEVAVTKQYRNMADWMEKEPRAVALAAEAHRRLGREPKLTIIRGGTDGSQLTERGLPTPNLSSGQHNPHSPLEWACLDEMIAACEVLVELVKLWGEERK